MEFQTCLKRVHRRANFFYKFGTPDKPNNHLLTTIASQYNYSGKKKLGYLLSSRVVLILLCSVMLIQVTINGKSSTKLKQSSQLETETRKQGACSLHCIILDQTETPPFNGHKWIHSRWSQKSLEDQQEPPYQE